MTRPVVIIGAGAAGLSAALELAGNGVPSILISQASSERAQSVMAEGGINAALNTLDEGDAPKLHAEDTIKAGQMLGDPDAILHMAEAAPSIIADLYEQGLSLNLKADNQIDLRAFGGQSKKRTVYADISTGKQLMHTLIAQLRRYEADGLVYRMTGWHFLELQKKNDAVCGCCVYCRKTGELKTVAADAVIIASGGMNGLFGNATGSILNTGAVTASLFASGIPIANGEMIQYHPTTVKLRGKNMLITEAVRGEGGRLYVLRDGKPDYFMEEKYPELGNLMPRDVISREEYRLIQAGKQIYLDMSELDKEIYDKKLSGVIASCRKFLQLDAMKDPIPVEPGIHYFMGGIYVDGGHKTQLKGLYAAGECACQYHGANRLGGNSLLGALYGGKTAAKSAMNQDEFHVEMDLPQSSKEKIICDKEPKLHLPTAQKKLQDTLRQALGVIRNEKSLLEAVTQVESLRDEAKKSFDPDANLDENYAWEPMCLLSLALLHSALERKESRGAHNRQDYSDINQIFEKTTVAVLREGNIDISFQSVGGVSFDH